MEPTTLGQLGNFLRGKGIKRDEVSGVGVPCIRYGELYTAYEDYTFETRSFVSQAVAETALPLGPGDLLFAGSGETRAEIGKCVAYVGPTPAVVGGDVLVLRGDQFNSIYLALLLNTPAMAAQKARVGQGDAVVHIYRAALAAIEVDLPSRSQQDAIADVVIDANREITSLGRHLAKVEYIKRGMMQELLTGKTRLPGFGGSWVEAEVGDLLAFKNGLNKAREYFGAGTPIVNFMDVMRGPIITAAGVAGKVTLTRDEIKRFSARQGDLFFTRTSETVDEVGTVATLIDDVPDAVFSGFILRGRPKTDELDPRFLAHLFQLAHVRRQVTSLATYTTRALTNGGSLGRVIVRLPNPGEQGAIADVIAEVDREIAALRRRIAKAREMKTGMMQELLTGRTSLPMAGSTA